MFNNMLFLVAVAAVISITTGCFITNCPPSGKRNIGLASRECLPCGSDGRGRCVGPDICCSPDGGCQFGTRDTLICRLEALNPRLCKVPGNQCGNGSGVCAADGVCCTNDSCTSDKSCQRMEGMERFLGRGFPRLPENI